MDSKLLGSAVISFMGFLVSLAVGILRDAQGKEKTVFVILCGICILLTGLLIHLAFRKD